MLVIPHPRIARVTIVLPPEIPSVQKNFRNLGGHDVTHASYVTHALCNVNILSRTNRHYVHLGVNKYKDLKHVAQELSTV